MYVKSALVEILALGWCENKRSELPSLMSSSSLERGSKLPAVNKENIKKLQGLPKDTLFIVCDISDPEVSQKRFSIRQGGSENVHLNYLKNLAADFKNNPDHLSKEKVTPRVGDDTEVVNKAVLCSQSPVFARMLESDMQEKMENCVTIDDVKIETVRGLISYLCSGIVPNTDTNFLYDLYFIANKYDISELRDECRHVLDSKFTVENVRFCYNQECAVMIT
ncbi:speckle-type POZ protein [Trichonephila clavipes]|nr:speckle-type POZ protein [Trichonephila clavipes]